MPCRQLGVLRSARIVLCLALGIAAALAIALQTSHSALPARAAVNPTTTIQLGFLTGQVTVADINGDGKPDLLVSGSAQAVLLGNGDGTFQAPKLAFAPGRAVLGDFNGDGKLDLAVASPYGVSVLLGNGDGTFGPALSFSTDPGPRLAAADLNGDHVTDLVVTSSQAQETTVFLSNGDGTFHLSASYPAAAGASPIGAVLADFNVDGKTDMVRLNSSTPMEFFAGAGNGTFGPPVQLPVPAQAAAVADMNGDGKPDLVIYTSTGCVGTMLSNGNGTFAFGGPAAACNLNGSLVVGDFNGDGEQDAAIVATGAILTMLGDGHGGLATPSAAPTSATSEFHEVAAGDFNGDGHVDLALTNDNSDSLTIYLNDGSASYPVPGNPVITPTSLDFGSVPAWATSQPQPVTFTNPGPGNLYITGESGSGSGSFNPGFAGCPINSILAAGATCTFEVTFTPTTSGTQTASLTITDTAPSGSQSVNFKGVGTVNPSTLTLAPATGPYGATVNLSGTLTSNGSPLAAGGWVTLTLPNGWTARSFTDRKGNFGFGGASIAGLAPGVYPGGIKATFDYDGAYLASSASADLTVLPPAPPVISVARAAGTYGGSAYLTATITEQGYPLVGVNISFAINGVPAGSNTSDGAGTTSVPAQLAGIQVGDYPSAVTAVFAGNGTSSAVNASGELDVSPASLTITASTAFMTYGGQPPAVTPSYSGFVNGDTAASLTTLPNCTGNAAVGQPVGPYPTSCSGAADANYVIGYVTGKIFVMAAPLTITASSGSSTYGSPVTITPSFSGLVNNDTPASLTTPPTCTTNAGGQPVGSYASSCSGAVDPNYSIAYVAGSITVAPAPLTITASGATITYGSPTPAITASYSGFVNGDTAASLPSGPSCTTSAGVLPVGTYATSCSGAVDANYAISYVAGSVTATPAPLTITASSATITYGSPVPSITASYSGFVNGETGASLSTPPTCSTNAGGQPVGTYASSCSGAVDGNYAIVYVQGSVTVLPPLLTITASSATITYGSPAPAIVPSYSGFVNGDTAASLTTLPTCTTNAGGKPVGTYATSCSGAVDANYTIAYVAGSITITPASLTVTANNQSKLFGAPNPVLTATITGFVNGDGAAVVSGSPSCTTPAFQPSPGGSYTISCARGTLTAANYILSTFLPGTLSVGYTSVITGTVPGLTVSSGQSVLIARGAVVKGSITVNAGGALDIEGATIAGLTSSGATAVRICASTTSGPMSISKTTGLVVVGDDEDRTSLPACAGSTMKNPVNISGNFGGVEFDGNTVTGPLQILSNVGTTPDGNTVDVTGNTVNGKISVQP